jgi:hypothetical protein
MSTARAMTGSSRSSAPPIWPTTRGAPGRGPPRQGVRAREEAKRARYPQCEGRRAARAASAPCPLQPVHDLIQVLPGCLATRRVRPRPPDRAREHHRTLTWPGGLPVGARRLGVRGHPWRIEPSIEPSVADIPGWVSTGRVHDRLVGGNFADGSCPACLSRACRSDEASPHAPRRAGSPSMSRATIATRWARSAGRAHIGSKVSKLSGHGLSNSGCSVPRHRMQPDAGVHDFRARTWR